MKSPLRRYAGRQASGRSGQRSLLPRQPSLQSRRVVAAQIVFQMGGQAGDDPAFVIPCAVDRDADLGGELGVDRFGPDQPEDAAVPRGQARVADHRPFLPECGHEGPVDLSRTRRDITPERGAQCFGV